MKTWLVFFLILPLPAPGGADGTIDLSAAVKRAAARGGDLASALLEVRAGEAGLSAAGRRLLPAFSAAYTRNDQVVYDGPDSRLRKISASLTHTVFDGGENRRALAAGERRLGLLRRAAAAAEEEIAVRVAERYTDILALRVRRRTLEEALAAALFQLSVAEEEKRLGVTTETDALLAAAEVKDLELELASAALKEKRAGFEFDRLLGCRDGETLRPRGDIDPDYAGIIDPGDEEKYLDAARKRSPAVQELSARVSDLRDAARTSEGRFLPEIEAGLEFSLAGQDFPLSRPGVTIHLRAAWTSPGFPLAVAFAAGKEGSYERTRSVDAGFGPVPRGMPEDPGIARARLGLAAREFADGMEDLRFAVREELAAVGHLRRTADILREKVGIREKRLAVLGLRVEIGEAGRLELLQEGIEVSRARIGVIDAVMDLFRRETTLLRLCGIYGVTALPPPILIPGDDE